MAEHTLLGNWNPLLTLVLAFTLVPLGVANAETVDPPSSNPSSDEAPHEALVEEPAAFEPATPSGEAEVVPTAISDEAPSDALTVVRENEHATNGSESGQNSASPPTSADASATETPTVGTSKTPEEHSTEEQAAADRSASEHIETAVEAPTERAAPSTQVRVTEKGLRVTTSDGRFAFGLMPFVQMGYRQVASDFADSSASGFALQHFRPIITGKYTEYLSYNFILQATASNVNILNAFVTLHPHSRLNIRLGLQKPVFGIELRQGQPNVLFINRSMASTIGSARDIGLALDARPVDQLRIEVGVYNGTDDTKVFSGIQERSVGGDASVRVYALGNDRPATKDDGFLIFGAAALLRRNEGDATTTHLTARKSAAGHTYSNYADGTFADGRKFASTVFAHGGYKGLYFQGEFTTSNQQVSGLSAQGRIVERAWAAAATYTIGGITGWNGTTPNRSLFDGGLGALQIKARGHGFTARARGGDFLDLGNGPADSLSAIGASAGLSWFLSPGFRVLADYNWTTFGANAKRLPNATEHILYIGIAAGY